MGKSTLTPPPGRGWRREWGRAVVHAAHKMIDTAHLLTSGLKNSKLLMGLPSEIKYAWPGYREIRKQHI